MTRNNQELLSRWSVLVNTGEVTWKDAQWQLLPLKNNAGIHWRSRRLHQQPAGFCPSSLLIRHIRMCVNTHTTFDRFPGSASDKEVWQTSILTQFIILSVREAFNKTPVTCQRVETCRWHSRHGYKRRTTGNKGSETTSDLQRLYMNVGLTVHIYFLYFGLLPFTFHSVLCCVNTWMLLEYCCRHKKVKKRTINRILILILENLDNRDEQSEHLSLCLWWQNQIFLMRSQDFSSRVCRNRTAILLIWDICSCLQQQNRIFDELSGHFQPPVWLQNWNTFDEKSGNFQLC